jgi:hypothetical protein
MGYYLNPLTAIAYQSMSSIATTALSLNFIYSQLGIVKPMCSIDSNAREILTIPI